MAACEACWSKAYAIAVRTGQHQADVYRRLLDDEHHDLQANNNNSERREN